MALTVRVLTGSRAGQELTFADSDEVTIGRHPSSKVLFDPEIDRVVSGSHASILFNDHQWLLRDLGSSNGTFVNGEAVKERVLHPGEVVQLGKNGPKIQVQFDAPEQQRAGYAAPAAAIMSGPPPVPEGRTVMMSFPQSGAAPAGAPAPYLAATPKKKGGMGRALIIVGAVVFALLVGLVALALVVRSVNVKKQRQIAAAKRAQIEQKQQEAQKLNEAIVQKQQEVAQTQAQIQQAQQTPTASSTAATTGGAESEDLKRQLAESQAMLEQMTRELQAKNDEIAAAKARPVAPPRPRHTEGVPVARQPRPIVTNSGGSTQVAQTSPQPSTPTTTPTVPQPVVPSSSSAATAATNSSSNASSSTAAVYPGKRLKKRVAITTTPPEIAPANMPSGIARDLAVILGDSLTSTGDFVVGQRGQASVSVMITNYRSIAQKTVDTKKASESVRAIGGLLGRSVPSNPLDVRSVAYDAGMSLRIRLYDPSGRTLSEVDTSADSQDRKTKTALAGVSFREIALSDTATGDVARKVVGDAIDTLRKGMADQEWSTNVERATSDGVTLSAGRTSNVEPGDVFEITESRRVLGRVRVTSITESSAETEWLTPKASVSNKSIARYLGSENQPQGQNVPRTLTVRAKTSAFDGPGNSFNEIGPLSPGKRLQFQYAVGTWAKVSDGGKTFWVPLQFVTINT